MFLIVSYDITNDKRRNKVSQTLLDFGTRVQYSVFECDITPVQYQVLRTRLQPLVDEQEDSIRFYQLCKHCIAQVEFLGEGKLYVNEEFYIV